MNPAPQLTEQDTGTRLALEGVKIRSTVSGFSQDVVLEQSFRNPEKRAIEAVYTFPLPEDAVVHSFEIYKADRRLVGELEESVKAQDRYMDALGDGNSAYLMESLRPDIFSTMVGNLGPGEAVTLRIGYVAQLRPVDDSVRLSFPTTVSPRYVPVDATDTETQLDGDAVNPPKALKVPYGLDFEVAFDAGFPLESAESPSHALETLRNDDDSATVRLAEGETEMDRDVVLELALKRQPVPYAVGSKGPQDENFVTVTFFPEFEESDHVPPPLETVFLIDASGSMRGASYQQAAAALALSLRSLREGDTFNILRFGSNYEKWKNAPQPYTRASLDEALAYLEHSDADLGGTELHRPLQDLFGDAVRTGNQRDVIVLTDGQVSNEAAVHQLARDHAEQNRIFTFGIGSGASTHLVNGLAKATGGAAEFIADSERIEPKVLRTFSRMASPRITDLRLELDGGKTPYDLANDTLPPIFDGDAFTLHAKVSGALPQEVVLHGQSPDGAIARATAVQPAAQGAEQLPHQLWAFHKIRHIEAHERTGYSGNYLQNRKTKHWTNSVVKLSKMHGILSRRTQFIAVEYRLGEDRLEGEPELRRIPVQLTRNWGGVRDHRVAYASELHSPREPRESVALFECVTRPQKPSPCYSPEEDVECMPSFDACADLDLDPLLDLLGHQQANGNFATADTDTDVAKEVQAALDSVDGETDTRVSPTLAALVVLNREHADAHNQWKRAANKALNFLRKTLGEETVRILSKTLGLRNSDPGN